MPGARLTAVPDDLFQHARLAAVYDGVTSPRDDLDAYVAIVDELGARSVLDIGCGTGTFACLLAARGLDVTAIEPAAASLEIARAKALAASVRWLAGDATSVPVLQVDMVTMTGNVAQVFLTDDAWASVLRRARTALRLGGHLVFETRDPARRAWRRWNRDETFRRLDVGGAGVVRTWVEVAEVALPLVTFTTTFVFESDGAVLTSASTLRFRTRDEIGGTLMEAGFVVDEVRDAPDRPGLEFVFVATQAAPARQPRGVIRR
jgi:SAM-dependent methyltransferase